MFAGPASIVTLPDETPVIVDGEGDARFLSVFVPADRRCVEIGTALRGMATGRYGAGGDVAKAETGLVVGGHRICGVSRAESSDCGQR
jgi:hypothetical protein